MPSHITLKGTLLDLQPTGTRRICVNSILPHPRAGRHEVLRYSAPSPQRFGANSHDHQECNTLGRWRRLPDHDLDLVVSTRADGRRHRTRKLLAPARRLRPAVRPLCRARPLLAPASPLWPSAGRLWPSTGKLHPAEPVCPAAGWTSGDNQTAHRPTRVMFHHPGRHSATWRRANTTTGCSRKTWRSARRVCARNAALSPIRSYISSASTALLDTSPTAIAELAFTKS